MQFQPGARSRSESDRDRASDSVHRTILESDRKAPRKQRHTAHRIWQRLRIASRCEIAESAIRRYVRARKKRFRAGRPATCVPQSYDWGRKRRWIGTKHRPTWAANSKLQVFSMRSMAQRRGLSSCLSPATQQAFLEAHEHAFGYFGGVFRLFATTISRPR